MTTIRQFKAEADWVIDEFGWRIGKVFTDTIPAKPEATPPEPERILRRAEFFDRRYIQKGDKILTALEQQEAGTIEGVA